MNVLTTLLQINSNDWIDRSQMISESLSIYPRKSLFFETLLVVLF